jgi:hypothetical protein
VAIAEHVAWLRRCGLGPDSGAETNVEIVEEVCAGDEPAVEGEFCFADDLRPLTPAEIESGIAVMACSRAGLLAAVDGVPDGILDWRPPASAMAQIDEWKPAPLTIREIVSDVASAESYYRRGLTDGPTPDEPGADAGDLTLQRERLIGALRALPDDQRMRRFEPVRSWQSGPEHWAARKVVRRVISHERFHTAEIRQRLSWLLVGVPRFRD